MVHDSDYCRRRAAEARAAACHKDDSESVAIAGHLALAYASLARSRKLASERSEQAQETGAMALSD